MSQSSYIHFPLGKVVLTTFGIKEGADSSWLGLFHGSIGYEDICSGPGDNEWDFFLSTAEQDFNGLVEVILYCKGS